VNTPRTDAHSNKMDNEDFDVELALTYDLARQLETELQSMTALADSLAEAIAHSPYSESLAEALDAYENHKKPTP
jgi:hypothetical protein